MKGMIFAAGLGTRLKPFTDKHPKALALVNGKTLLQRNIEYLNSFGITELIINVHHFADQIIALIKDNNGFGSSITISDERDEVLETGGGLKKASWFFSSDERPFVLMNVDVLTDLSINEMAAQHFRNNPIATLAVTSRQTSRYFLFDDEGILCGWKNSLTAEEKISRQAPHVYEKAFSGIHIISPDIFNYINRQGKFSIVDVYLEIARTHVVRGFDHSGTKFIDVGKPDALAKAERMFI